MPISVSCPSCSAGFKVKDEYAGKRAKCPKCGQPITIPVVDTVLMPPPAKAAAPVAARPVVASKPKPTPVPVDDEADEPGSPKRKRGADDDENPRAKKRAKDDEEDDNPRSRKGKDEGDEGTEPKSRRKRGDDTDDDTPRSKRRRGDDDDEPKKKSKALPIILGVVGGLLLLCGGGCAGVWFGVIVPAAEKARARNSERQAELDEWEKNLNPQAGGAELSAAKLGQIRPGMTVQQVESVLGRGTPADNSAVVLATAGAPFELGASKRWSAKQQLGHVSSWDVFPNRVLVAFTADPKAGGTVEGVGASLRNSWSEPIPLAGPGDGSELTAANVAKLKAGMTQAEVQAVLGVGTKADIGHLGRCAPSLPPTAMQDALPRWTDAVQRGVVRHWEHNLTASHVLVAYTSDPTTGGTVDGVLAKVDFKGTEPIKLPGGGGGTPTIPTTPSTGPGPNVQYINITATALAKEFDANPAAAETKYKGKDLKVTGVVSEIPIDAVWFSMTGVSPPASRAVISVPVDVKFGAWGPIKKMKVGDTVTVTGKFKEFVKGKNNAWELKVNDAVIVAK